MINTSSEIVLKTSAVTKSFKDYKAVNNVSMTIGKGQIYGLVGKNGAGKTTLMRVILGLAFAEEGQVTLFGVEGKDNLKFKNEIGALIEQPVFYDNLTAYQNLDVHRTLCGIEDKTQIDRVLNIVNLHDTGNKKAKSFSLGMKQRLGIAQALINNPKFLILDEPVNGLDPEGVKEIRDVLLRLVDEQGLTVMISSHILSELSMLATHYGFMDRGYLIEEISAKDLHAKAKKQMIIQTDNNDKTKEVLKNEFKITKYTEEKNTLVIENNTEHKLAIQKALIMAGVDILKFEIHEVSLEEYFLNLVGGRSDV